MDEVNRLIARKLEWEVEGVWETAASFSKGE
jgi:hypothetical protein